MGPDFGLDTRRLVDATRMVEDVAAFMRNDLRNQRKRPLPVIEQWHCEGDAGMPGEGDRSAPGGLVVRHDMKLDPQTEWRIVPSRVVKVIQAAAGYSARLGKEGARLADAHADPDGHPAVRTLGHGEESGDAVVSR